MRKMTRNEATEAQTDDEVTPEDQYETGDEVHHTLSANNVDEYGLDGPRPVARFVRGINQEREAEVLLAADAGGPGVDDPLAYLALHEMPDEHSAALFADFDGEPDSAYVGNIEDVAEALAELMERDDVWVVRGDEDSLEAIRSYQ